MSDLRTAVQQALEALEALQGGCTDSNDGTVEAITVWCPEVIEALRAALEQPEPFQPDWDRIEPLQEALREHMAEIHRLRAALEQPEQEPLAWLESPYGSIRMNATMRFQFPPQSLKWKIPLYTQPPRREWRGLTEEEVFKCLPPEEDEMAFARALETKLKERNA